MLDRPLLASAAVCRRATAVGVGLLFLLLPGGALLAQVTGVVAGRVRGRGGEPLQGATVALTGTTRGAIARADGSYRIVAPAGRYEIRGRLVGYAAGVDTVEIPAAGTVTRDFTLDRAVTNLEAVAIVGSRGQARTVIDAPAPIDVLSPAELRETGRVETAQMIQAAAPSFNFPRTSIGDGTDHIRPATLRGLSPDQTLVLVNGKRRHPSALVNLNGFVGRGSQAVDLNAIPANMIERIEILREGAAAQYGSDAIAGVINIVLKSTASGGFTTQFGQNFTTYNRDATTATAYPLQQGERSARDGRVAYGALNYGWTFGDNGYFQIDGEVRDRQGTNRTLADPRPQCLAGTPLPCNPPLLNHWQGDSWLHDVGGMLNAGTTLASGIDLYAFGGLTRRGGASAGFWRRQLDDRTLRNLYPNGFLPFIKSRIWDGSGVGGARGGAGAWKYDLSASYGRNSFDFVIDNSNNVSLGAVSPTRFDAGGLRAGQFTTNLDLTRSVVAPWRAPLQVAVGAEFRNDRYAIAQGDPASWDDGGEPVRNPDGSPKIDPVTNLPVPGPPGSQVFPGFQPSDAGTHSRTNVAGYVDLESNLTRQLLVGLAGRYEHYSDFGSTTTGRANARLELARQLALRGTVSTGFRAPSLGQEFFSSTATNFISGRAFDIRTFPVASAGAQLLGAEPLRPEKSVNYGLGVVLEPMRSLAVTVDGYRIDIRDRIVLSDNFVGPAIRTLFQQNGLGDLGGGRYFTNAIDTHSAGLDVVASYGIDFSASTLLRLTAGYNTNTVRVVHVDTTPTRLSAFQETLFGRVERTRIEKGNPRNNLLLSGNLDLGMLGLTARTQRYGKVSVAGATPTNATGPLDQTYGAKWVTDASASVKLLRRFTLTAGADNIFDVYPDRNLNRGDPTTTNGGLSNFGIFPYAGISPFGFNGRFAYVRLSGGL